MMRVRPSTVPVDALDRASAGKPCVVRMLRLASAARPFSARYFVSAHARAENRRMKTRNKDVQMRIRGTVPAEAVLSKDDDGVAAVVGEKKVEKPRIVVLGSGWATATFLKTLHGQQKDGDTGNGGGLDVVVVSPRNYFLYTPLLPSTITGLVEERSIVEPMRSLVKGKGKFVEAAVLDVDPENKVLTCEKTYCSVCEAKAKKRGQGKPENTSAAVGDLAAAAKQDLDHDHVFKLSYDVLVVAVGSVTADFGVPGVREHCWFMKSIEDAHSLRVHLSKRFEQAALIEDREKRRKLLNVTVIGGGPTGVEVAAEMSDFALKDMARLFPEVPLEDIQINLVDPGDHVLRAYSPSIGQYAEKLFERQHVNLMLNKRITGVEEDVLRVLDMATGNDVEIPYGTCVWATGVAPHPLVTSLKKKLPSLPGDSMRQGLQTDSFFRVYGSPQDSILALGDCAVVGLDLVSQASSISESITDKDHQGRMDRHAVTEKVASLSSLGVEDIRKQLDDLLDGTSREQTDTIDQDELLALLFACDKKKKPLPATAQVARQEAAHLAQMINRGSMTILADGSQKGSLGADGSQKGSDSSVQLSSPLPAAFEYRHLGQLAYLGGDEAAFDLPIGGDRGTLHGLAIGHLWKGMETMMQVSPRNMSMVFFDWVRTKIFGRNMSDV